MFPRRVFAYLLAGAALAVVISGCGGGGSGGRARAGALRVSAEFPPRETPGDVSGRVIPEGAECIYVAVTSPSGALLGECLLKRPSGATPDQAAARPVAPAVEVSATIDNLPLGPAVVTAEAFGPAPPSEARALRPDQPPLASATARVKIEPGVNKIALTLESCVTTVEVTPPSAQINIGQNQQFVATAKDGDGAILLGATFDWSSSDTGVATVDEQGLALGAGSGTCNITATERASGVQGSAQLQVTGQQVSGDMLIIQDEPPWGCDPNPTVATDLSIAYAMINASALPATDLSGFDVVVLAGDQGDAFYSTIASNLSQIASFVANGGVYLVHHARSSGVPPGDILPSGGGIAWTVYYGTDINILNPASGLITGPGGTITDTNLDGGNYSLHGWADPTSLPAGADAILGTPVGTPDALAMRSASAHGMTSAGPFASIGPRPKARGGVIGPGVVVFRYEYGSGDVLVSTIPVEYYDAGHHGDQPNIGSIYHYNEFAYAMSLAP